MRESEQRMQVCKCNAIQYNASASIPPIVDHLLGAAQVTGRPVVNPRLLLVVQGHLQHEEVEVGRLAGLAEIFHLIARQLQGQSCHI